MCIRDRVNGAGQDRAWSTGDIEAGMVTMGMCGGLINEVPSCEQLVGGIVEDAMSIINKRLASMVHSWWLAWSFALPFAFKQFCIAFASHEMAVSGYDGVWLNYPLAQNTESTHI